MSCIHGEPGSIKAEAEEDSEVWFLPASMAMKMIRENNQWLEYLLHSYHQRFEELLEVVEAVTFKKANERLWLLLQKKAALASSKLIHTTHEQLANELATARVVISRLLKQLEDEGKIITGRNKITLL
jgi:CRP/FNR family transcriptional regulator